MVVTNNAVSAVEEWHNLSAAAERRKVQNRLSQRSHRKNVKLRQEAAARAAMQEGINSNSSGSDNAEKPQLMENGSEEGGGGGGGGGGGRLGSSSNIKGEGGGGWPDKSNLTTQAQQEQQDFLDQSIAKFGLQMPAFFPSSPPNQAWANTNTTHGMPSAAFQPLDLEMMAHPGSIAKGKAPSHTNCPKCGAMVGIELNRFCGKDDAVSNQGMINDHNETSTSMKSWTEDPQFFTPSAAPPSTAPPSASRPSIMAPLSRPSPTSYETVNSKAARTVTTASPKAGTEQDWTTMLHIAAKAGHTAMARTLLENGADINERDSTGATVLHRTALAGNEEMVKLLLFHNADKDLLDQAGWSSEHRAVEGGNDAVLRLLLNHDNSL